MCVWITEEIYKCACLSMMQVPPGNDGAEL